MKRKTKEVEKRTYKMKGAFPTFISLVDRGANFTPLKEIRFSDTEKFSQDVEINRIEFSKKVFADQAAVESYLAENDYQEYSVVDSGETFSVLGIESDKFEEVQPLELEEGVLYFVGKLKEEEDDPTPELEQEQPAAIILESEEFSDKKPEDDETKEEVVIEEVVTESENTEENNEKEQTEAEQSNSEETNSEFSEEIKEEVLTEPEQGTDKFAEIEAKLAKFEELENKIKELQEKLAKFEEKEEDTIDEKEILIQNSHSVHSDVIVIEQEKSIDETSQKFSEKRRNDLFGLRG